MIECHFQSLKSIGRLKFAKILFLANTSRNKYIHTYIRDKHKVDSHGSDAFGPYFEKVYFLNIQNEQRLYITHSEARHLHLINSHHFFCFCKF